MATAICYALLAFNVFHVGEKLIPNTKEYIDMPTIQDDKDIEQRYLEEELTIQEETWHFAANTQRNIDNLCAKIDICEKITFNGDYTDIDRYLYIKIIDKIFTFIDTNGKENKPIKKVINDIQMNKEYGKRRWYATRDSIVFNVWSLKSKTEFIELSTHEIGHITDLWYIQWSSLKKDRDFTEFGKVVFATNDFSLSFYKISRDKEKIRKAEAKKKDFCSGYGMSDPFEDFAECFNLYINHNSFFREIAKNNSTLRKKYNSIASIFNGKYISSNTQDLIFVKDNSTRRPRDTTKLTN